MKNSDHEKNARVILEDLAAELASLATTDALTDTLKEEASSAPEEISYEAFKDQIRKMIGSEDKKSNTETPRSVAAGVQEGWQAGKLWIRATLDEGLRSLRRAVPFDTEGTLSRPTVAGIRGKNTDAESQIPTPSIESTLIPVTYSEQRDNPEVHILGLKYRKPDTSPQDEPEVRLWLDKSELEYAKERKTEKGTFTVEYESKRGMLTLYFVPGQRPLAVEVTAEENVWIIHLTYNS